MINHWLRTLVLCQLCWLVLCWPCLHVFFVVSCPCLLLLANCFLCSSLCTKCQRYSRHVSISFPVWFRSPSTNFKLPVLLFTSTTTYYGSYWWNITDQLWVFFCRVFWLTASCSQLPALANGRFNFSEGNKTGSKATPVCNSGFQAAPSPQSTTCEDGLWKEPYPTCKG